MAEPLALVARYLERALIGEVVPERVRIEQEGRMWMKPGGRALRFKAVEELEVRRVAFSWRARFPFGLRVSDGYSEGAGKLDVRFLGIPFQRQAGPEIDEGEPRPWGGEYSDYRVLDGLRLPTSGEVYWELPTGRFVYWRGRVLTAQA